MSTLRAEKIKLHCSYRAAFKEASADIEIHVLALGVLRFYAEAGCVSRSATTKSDEHDCFVRDLNVGEALNLCCLARTTFRGKPASCELQGKDEAYNEKVD